MQVFVPSDNSFEHCASVLDSVRLNKQVLEIIQILNVTLDIPKDDGTQRTGWKNHPAVIAWKHNSKALLSFGHAYAQEASKRGIKVTKYLDQLHKFDAQGSDDMPSWWGDKLVHQSHRYRLLQKAHERLEKTGKRDQVDWYSQWNWDEARDPDFRGQRYWWPIWHGSTILQYRLERRGKN